MLLQFWSGVEVLGPLLPSHWFELGSLGIGMLSHSSFSSLGDTWLPLSMPCDVRLGQMVTGRAWREENIGMQRGRVTSPGPQRLLPGRGGSYRAFVHLLEADGEGGQDALALGLDWLLLQKERGAALG